MAFQLKPNKKETENIVLQACEYALDNMETKKKEPQNICVSFRQKENRYNTLLCHSGSYFY